MDPITHIASGILAGQAVRDRFPPGRWLVWFTVATAWAPDIDNLATWFGPEAYMRYHRGVTHSFAGGAAMALVLAFAWTRFKRDVAFGKLALLGYACVLMHSFLDVITSYGTQIFQPFSDARIAFPVVYIVDPFFTGLLVLLALATFFAQKKRKELALAGLALILAYPAANLGAREYVAASFEKGLEAEGVRFDRLRVIPAAFAPLAWKAVVEDGETYRLAGLDVLHPDRGPRSRAMRRADPELLRSLGQEASIFSTFGWFADYPVVEERTIGNGRELVFSDARFMMYSPFLSDSWRQGYPPFTLMAEINAQGRLTSWRFHSPGSPDAPAQIIASR